MAREKVFNQDTVVKKCIDLFAKNGYGSTGIQEIVNTTGINRSSLYATFKGKEELFFTCIKKVIQDDIAAMEVLFKKNKSPVKFLNAYLGIVTKEKPAYHLLKHANAEFLLLNKKTQSAINTHYQWKIVFIGSILNHGQKIGKFTKKIESKDITAILELIVHSIALISPLANSEKMYKKSITQFSMLIQKKK